MRDHVLLSLSQLKLPVKLIVSNSGALGFIELEQNPRWSRKGLDGPILLQYAEAKSDFPGGLDAEIDEGTNFRWRMRARRMEGAQLMARSRSDISLFDSLIDSYRVAGLLPAQTVRAGRSSGASASSWSRHR